MKFNNIEEIKIYLEEFTNRCQGHVTAFPNDFKAAVCEFYETTIHSHTSLFDFSKKVGKPQGLIKGWMEKYEAGLFHAEGAATHTSQKSLSAHQMTILKIKQDLNRKEQDLKRQLEELEKEKSMMAERIAFINQAERLGISVSL
ncbi:coil containing protein [Vibrio phage 1.187.O._10N.286.49.F1]|nr:coil containing protein [Vibrio phage 1.187.O._10N.286.49.F1]